MIEAGPAAPGIPVTTTRLRAVRESRANMVPEKRDATDPDANLLARYASGDSRAAADLFDSLSGRLYALGIRMLGDPMEAEDVVQETMMRLWKIAPDWRRGEAKVSSWTYGVARNLCLDRLRKRRFQSMDEAPEPIDDTPLPLDTMIADNRVNALREAMNRLPERQRQAIALRHLEEMSNPDIAQELDASVEAVESLLARGRRRLAQLLSPVMERI